MSQHWLSTRNDPSELILSQYDKFADKICMSSGVFYILWADQKF